MKITISCENFPVSLLGKMVEEISSHGITPSIQVGGTDTVFATTEVNDITKAQIFCILIDKYRFAQDGGDP